MLTSLRIYRDTLISILAFVAVNVSPNYIYWLFSVLHYHHLRTSINVHSDKWQLTLQIWSLSKLRTGWPLAWENGRHLAMAPKVSSWNDVWAKSAEIPYWWRVTTQSTSQKHYPDLGSDASSVWNFCARFSDVISRGKPLVASRYVSCFLRLADRRWFWNFFERFP